MNAKHWIIETIFQKDGLVNDILDFMKRWKMASSVLLNLTHHGIYGEEREFTAGKVVEWLQNRDRERSYAVKYLSGSAPQNPRFSLMFLTPYMSTNFGMSSDEKESWGKELNERSHSFFLLMKYLGYDYEVIRTFPKSWAVKEIISTNKTVADLQKRKEWNTEEYPNSLFFWTTDGSYKELFAMNPKYFPQLVNYLGKIGIKVKEVK